MLPTTVGVLAPTESKTAAARRARSELASPTSSTVAPRSAFNWAGVPSAMTWPWSTTAMRCARVSASSRYCVVRSTLVPLAHEVVDHGPHIHAAVGIEPGGGLVEEQHLRSRHQGGGDVQSAPHTTGVGLERPVTGVGETELVEQLDGALGHHGPLEVVQAPDHGEVLAAGEVLVHGRVLAGQADDGPDALGLLHDVVPEDEASPGVGGEDRGQDTDRGGLAGAVGTEQAEDGALLDGEAHSVEGAHLPTEGLAQFVCLDGIGHRGVSLLGCDV